ncbi:MAG: restriction endonuclease [Nanoarchaeota archaeon]|nr:restriction endonuclease [Nanoarchaeota archaeon]
MNHWMDLSIQFANQKNYLDELFKIYPTIPEDIREVDSQKWKAIEKAFNNKNKVELLNLLLSMDLFPIKDSYIAYLKRDTSAIGRNPNTVDRIYGRLQELGLKEIYEKCTEPKETNRQIGPLFKRWILKGTLGAPVLGMEDFTSIKGNAILSASDKEMMNFAKEYLGYTRNKGLDFVARFNGKYVLSEAKFLTDFGGHQNAQFEDAISTLKTTGVKAVIIAILDGVLYIKGNNKMYKSITTTYKDNNIMSALALREFLYSL